jgi:P-type E1-E2 ATPase
VDISHRLQAALGDANVVVLGDSISAGSPLLMDKLRRMGVITVLLTGARSARFLASFGGRFFSCSPSDKARLIRKFKEEGSRVAFVGLGGSDQWGMMCADVRIDCPDLLANFGILPV